MPISDFQYTQTITLAENEIPQWMELMQLFNQQLSKAGFNRSVQLTLSPELREFINSLIQTTTNADIVQS